jgi:FMN-dependent NADH-azoreductase
MFKLLVVETSPRGADSISRTMTRRFVEDWRVAHPGGEVVARDLTATDLPFVTAPWLRAYFTPPQHHAPEMKEALRLSDQLVAELLATDHLVIATPVYNYNVPAALKAWIDHIVRKGMTLGFDGRGLVVGKKATLLLASGGIYGEGSPIRDRDLATHYLRLILNVIGITDVAGGGAKAVDMGEASMVGFVGRLRPEIQRAAAR